MPLTEAQAHSVVREGIRRTLWWSRLATAAYKEMEIADLRDELKEALGPEVRSEGARLLTLDVSIRRQFRLAGWKVRVPSLDWYRKGKNQGISVGAIAEYALARPMTKVVTEDAVEA